jgi:hypothetical protein
MVGGRNFLTNSILSERIDKFILPILCEGVFIVKKNSRKRTYKTGVEGRGS